MPTPYELGFYDILNPKERFHAKLADQLEDKSSLAADKGNTDFGSAMVNLVNQERDKAGLIEGGVNFTDVI